MYQTAFNQSVQVKKPSVQSLSGVITHISLNYYELECVRLALMGLSESIKSGVLPKSLVGVNLGRLKAQLRYLEYWLHKPILRSQLRLDGSNTALWPFTSSELVDWLLPICQTCINADVIFIASAEAIGFGYTTYSDAYLENDTLSSDLRAFENYYSDIVEVCQPILVDKLAAIKKQDYPLYPVFAGIN